MLFNSWIFIFVFLPITLIVFLGLLRSGHNRATFGWLLISSLVFYGYWNVAYLPLMLISIFVNYGIGTSIERVKQKSNRAKTLLLMGICFNLALLGYFKYADFLLSSFTFITNTSWSFPTIILPLGISFYTFTQTAYLVDAYRGETLKQNLVSYGLFVTFFPHLIAGPILHHKEMIPQFNRRVLRQFNFSNIAVGLTLFVLGLFKKVVFADNIATFVSPIFDAADQGSPITLFYAWGGALAYTMQLYFDFSGYSDMAIGIAWMFGIKLPLNFNSPYKAVNIIDFWRRWHITLSHFLRDYLYIPLGGNRKGKIRRYVNLMITMLLGGLWHGAGWTFVIWGGLHGIYLCVNHLWNEGQKSLVGYGKSRWWSRGLACLVTFIAVVIGWVFFRADSISTALTILKGMLGGNGISIPMELANRLGILKFHLSNWGVVFNRERESEIIFIYLWLLALIAIAWFTPNTQQWLGRYNPALEEKVIKPKQDKSYAPDFSYHWKPNVFFGLTVGVLLFITLKTALNAPQSEFLYFNF